MSAGPVMLGVEGTTLTPEDRVRLAHPSVGGVILFARNYASPAQVTGLVREIRGLRDPPLLVAVDHEGGRVQRFRDGFSAVPSMRTLGERYDTDRDGALGEARRWGRVIAGELGACGIDFSFTPVLDLDYGESAIIGHRAFHADAAAVAALAAALCAGLHDGGMAAVGKHFPGHGRVAADSHVALPVDARSFDEIAADDLAPFAALIAQDAIDGVMPAHIAYPAVAPEPAGFSPRWLKAILRGALNFDGLVFSDDLEMAGAHGAGDIVARADAAAAAGCDMVLACNDFAAMDDLLARWRPPANARLAARVERMRRRASPRADH
ncbi:MAG: beta-N-acetylhexosaminidase [Betaproteobacteria bacterium]